MKWGDAPGITHPVIYFFALELTIVVIFVVEQPFSERGGLRAIIVGSLYFLGESFPPEGAARLGLSTNKASAGGCPV